MQYITLKYKQPTVIIMNNKMLYNNDNDNDNENSLF